MQPITETIVFVRRRSRSTPDERRILWALPVVLMLSMASMAIWAMHWEVTNLSRIYAALRKMEPSSWLVLAPMVCIALVQIAIAGVHRNAKLVVGPDGIKLEQGSGSALVRIFFTERFVRWEDLLHVTYVSALRILQIRAKGQLLPWALRAADWHIETENGDGTIHRQKENATEPDLVRVFRENGFFEAFTRDPRLAAIEFDLAAHPTTKALLWILGALTLYCFIDGISGDEAWADFSPGYIAPHLLVALASVPLIGFWLESRPPAGNVPRRVAWPLAIVAGMVIGATSYVGGIRINQAIGDPLVEAVYHRDASCRNLLPEDQQLPSVEYTKLAKGYWCSIDEKAPVMVSVRKGLFGLYQVNLAKHTQAIRDYRNTH